ncbi:hypothetical protein Q5P01_025725 [Channa striata]|uniref:Uncharacterized protein n=1 Tax=Channa striata TaxID=64152 RepID=A0AA88J606_CHASR|nr:hypothetical protein Q5P01_025725 [Channa striata]
MAGSGVALRLHEFKESQASGATDGPAVLTPKPSRVGRDVHGLYPGQVGRVHTVPKERGFSLDSRRSQFPSTNHQHPNYQQSFDIRTLKPVSTLRHSPAAPDQRLTPQTVYQEAFGLQSAPCPENTYTM